MKKIYCRLINIIFILIMMMFTEFNNQVYNLLKLNKGIVEKLRIYLTIILIVITIIMILCNLIYLKRKAVIVFIFLMYCLFVTLYKSNSKIIGFQQIILLIGVTCLIIIISNNNILKKFDIIYNYCLFNIWINFISFFFFKNFSIAYYDTRYNNSLQGIFSHKNILSLYMIVSIGIIMCYIKLNKVNFINTISLFLAVINIILSKSSTGIITLIFLILSYVFSKRNRKKNIYIILIPIILNLLILTGVYKQITNINFTGRLYIWDYSISKIKENIIFGNGFYGFFSFGKHTISQIYVENVAHAHNGIIQILLELGLVGLILYLIIIKKCLNKKSFFYRENIIILSSIFVFNLTESYLISQFNIFVCWIITVFILFNTSNIQSK